MSPLPITLLTSLAMLAFAGNSLLNRLALTGSTLDAAGFTLLRLLSGAVFLWLLLRIRRRSAALAGNGLSALALFLYAAGFSFAYRDLTASTGALLLFGAVQATMILAGIVRGERPGRLQIAGSALALAGLLYLLLPGASAPQPLAAALMIAAGISWGVYSLHGRGSADPLADTAGNFIRAVPLALLTVAGGWLVNGELMLSQADSRGVLYALLSGALASGAGYALWYRVLPAMQAATAATVQLTVPALTDIAGVWLLAEPLTMRIILASLLILGGVAVYIRCRPPAP